MLKKLVISSIIALSVSLPVWADKKIAVMPFESPDKKEETQQFSFGTMASIIHTLKNVDDYIVIDRGQIENIIKELGFQQSSFTAKDQIKIGKLSGVDILVFGTIQKSNNNYRINVNFTDVQSGSILKTFQVTGSDMFLLQDQLSSEILRGSKLTAKDIIKTTNSKAYNNYIKAKDLSNNFDKKNLEKALSLLNQTIKSDNTYFQAYSERAKVNAMLALINKRNGINYLDKFSNAEIDAEKALEADNKDVSAYIALFITGEIEKKEDSKDIINNGIKSDKSEFSKYLSLLGSFYKNSNLEDAEYYYKLALDTDKNNVYSYHDLAGIYTKKKEYDKAIDLYKKSLEINPNFLSSKYNLAGTYIRNRDVANAKKQYMEIIQISPESSPAYFSLGGLSDGEEAKNYYKKAIEVDNKFTFAYSALADSYLSDKNFNEALVYAKKAVEIDPKDSYANYVLAMYYAKVNDKKKSLEIAKKVDIEDGNLLKDIYIENKMYDDAINIIKAEINKSPDEIYNYFTLATVYKDINKYDLAIDSVKLGLSKSASESLKKTWTNEIRDYYFLYGIEEYKKANYLNAIEMYNQAAQISEDSTLYNNIGIAYYMLKQYDKAIEQYQKSLKLNPNHVDSIVNLAMAYEVLGKSSEAENEYKKACTLGYKQKCK